VGQLNHDHTAAAELAFDFVVEVVGQFWRERVSRRWNLAVRALVALDFAGLRLTEQGMAGGLLSIAHTSEKAIGGQLGSAVSTMRAPFEVLVDSISGTVVELAQTVGAQDLVVGRGAALASMGRSPRTGRVTLS
jgi:hypothetical protein